MYLSLCFVVLFGFCLSKSSAAYDEPHCGSRQVIVHLFEWRWADVAAECERYLGPKGFCGVQVSPPNENAVVNSRPWWERYQPVSYKLTTRSGDETEFKDMVDRCKAVGVRIYVDAIINHMAGSDRTGHGTAGTSFNGGSGDFPGVPFTSNNLHSYSDCGARDINYQVARQVRNCDLVGLRDLDYSQSDVQNKVAAYLNKLIELGVAGFRVDASKHMWPNELSTLQSKLKDLPEGGRPFFYHEVIDYNTEPIKDDQYFRLGHVTEFRYHQKVRDGLYNLGRLRYVYDAGWSMVPSDHALVFVDNHDTQRQNGKLNYKSGVEYKRAVAFTLANDYGFVKVMSSFSFGHKDDGPPHESDYSTKSVSINADGTCGNGWVCEHRWSMVGNLARFRTAMHGQRVTNWQYTDRVLSFSRGNQGFFAMGLGDFTVKRNTGLPAGQYCDLISDCATTVTVDSNGQATIKPADRSEPFVAIMTDEKADDAGDANDDTPPVTDDTNISDVSTTDDDQPSDPPQPAPIVAPPTSDPTQSDPSKPILSGPSDPTQPDPSNPVLYDPSKPQDFQRTVIVIEKETRVGQDVFIRGGLDSSQIAGCTQNARTSPCSIPIRHHQDYTDDHYSGLTSWREGDLVLDWIGAEPGQGAFNGKKASGTPAFWSTGDSSRNGYSQLNKWGDHHWIVDIEMDCNRTLGGYFQVRAMVNTLMERRQRDAVGPCQGDGAPETVPFQSNYHIARCGYLNVFSFSKPECEIEKLA